MSWVGGLEGDGMERALWLLTMTNTIELTATVSLPTTAQLATREGEWLGRDYANSLRGTEDVTVRVAWTMALEADGQCGLARRVLQASRKHQWDAYCERAALWAARAAYVARMTGEG
jgi:hypothetical protein